MTANRYVSSTAPAPDVRYERYRETTVHHCNIPTKSEKNCLMIQEGTREGHISIICFVNQGAGIAA